MGKRIQCAKDFEPYKEKILSLFFNDNLTLKQVSKHMEETYGIEATDKQYKGLFRDSGRLKKIPASVWTHIRDTIRMRQEGGKGSEILWSGRRVDDKRLATEMSRYKQRSSCIHMDDPSLSQLVIRTPPGSPAVAHATGAQRSPISSVRASTSLEDEVLPDSERLSPSQLVVASSTRGSDLPSAWDVMDFCVDALSERDYGNVSVISSLDELLQGIPTYGNSRDMLLGLLEEHLSLFAMEEQSMFGSTGLDSRPSVPRGPTHSWIWESLTSVLASDSVSEIRSHVPGFPNRVGDLRYCTRTDLLNMLINSTINTANGAFVLDGSRCNPEIIADWCTSRRQRYFLDSLLNFQSRFNGRFVTFLQCLIDVCTTLYQLKTLDSPEGEVCHSVRMAFNSLEKHYNSSFPPEEATVLVRKLVSFDVPDLVSKLITSGADIRDIFYQNEAISITSAATATVLIENGADVNEALCQAWERFLAPNSEALEKRHHIFFSLPLVQGADPEQFPDNTAAENRVINIAEWAALRSADLGRIFLRFTTKSYTREIIQTFIDAHEGRMDVGPSPTHREFALLVAIDAGAGQVSEALLNAGTDPNCSILLKHESRNRPGIPYNEQYPGDIVRLIHGYGREFVPPNSAEDEFIYRFDQACYGHQMAPLARALNREWTSRDCNYDSVRSLLRAGSGVCADSVNELGRLFKTKGSLQNLKTLAPQLSQQSRLPDTRHILIRLALIDEDLEMIRTVFHDNATINDAFLVSHRAFPVQNPSSRATQHTYLLDQSDRQGIELLYGEETALGLAFRTSSYKVVDHLWRLGARLRVHGLPSGVYEVQNLLQQESHISEEDFVLKFNFLLDKGACLDPNPSSSVSLYRVFNTLEVLLNNFPRLRISYDTLLGTMDKLIAKGSNINPPNNKKHSSPLEMAAFRGLFNVMKYLLDSGANINIASERDQGQTLLEATCSVPEPHFPDQNSVRGSTCRGEIIDLLLEAGARVDAVSVHNFTALGLACAAGCLDGARLILQRGAPVEQRSLSCTRITEWNSDKDLLAQKWLTPLQIACAEFYIHRNLELVKILLTSGAEPNAVTDVFPTPLQTAVNLMDISLVRLLMEYGATAADSTLGQWPALHVAIGQGSFSLTLRLLESGAEVETIVEYNGKSSYYLPASFLGRVRGMYTAIQLAAALGHYDIVQLLINAGSERDVSVNKYSGAIGLAIENGHMQIARLLESHSHSADAVDLVTGH